MHSEARNGVEGEEPEMEVKGRQPVLMLDGKAANGALPERDGAKPGGADTATFFTSAKTQNGFIALTLRTPRLDQTAKMHPSFR